MAIYGIGAFYDNERDVSADFVQQGAACVGWSEEDAPAIHRLLEHIKTGDIIYIKAHPPGRQLTVKAVGIVLEEQIRDFGDLGRGVRVRWFWHDTEVIDESSDERYNVRSNTLYEELSPLFQRRILDLLFSGLRTR